MTDCDRDLCPELFETESDSLGTGAWVGIALGIAVVVILLIILIINKCFNTRVKVSSEEDKGSSVEKNYADTIPLIGDGLKFD